MTITDPMYIIERITWNLSNNWKTFLPLEKNGNGVYCWWMIMNRIKYKIA